VVLHVGWEITGIGSELPIRKPRSNLGIPMSEHRM
jgi:hypothetical protein